MKPCLTRGHLLGACVLAGRPIGRVGEMHITRQSVHLKRAELRMVLKIGGGWRFSFGSVQLAFNTLAAAEGFPSAQCSRCYNICNGVSLLAVSVPRGK